MLNAKNNEREAAIVAKAGEQGAVTLATNIAGRGTDIVLGDGVVDLGGLFVLGSERHESRRIDNQLRGRAGRQGDPGVTQFFVSTEDDLMRIFGGERIGTIMSRLGANDETPIENKIISRSLEKAQERVEGYNFDQRKNVVQYDDVMNRHRKAIYSMRREILKAVDISKRIKTLIEEEAQSLSVSPVIESDDFEDMVKEVFPFDEPTLDRLFDTNTDKFPVILLSEARELYAGRETSFGSDFMRRLERDIYLQVLDDQWMQHLENMDHLREGIHWMGVGQQDPLVEYRRQGQMLFDAMQQTLRHLVIRTLFNTYPVDVGELNWPVETTLTRAARSSIENAGQINRNQEEFSEEDFSKQPVRTSDQGSNRVTTTGSKKVVKVNERKKARKTERKRKTVAKRRKH